MRALEVVKQTVADHGLLAEADAILVGLSGGPDSVALLHLLSKLRKAWRLRIGAVYVNHQIRKRAAVREERFCRELCARLKVEFHLVREDIPALAKRRKQGIEEAAREFRYATFERMAQEHGYTKIAVGHHADDQVETIVFRFFRGTGPDGLRGMPVTRGKIIRPLLHLTRAEILNHLTRSRIKWCEDASNRSWRYRRNYVRRGLLPSVREALNPSVERAVLNLSDTIGEEEAFWEAELRGVARKCLRLTPGGKFCLALAGFRPYAVALRRRLLRRCLKATWQTESAPDKEVVLRLDHLADVDSGVLTLPGHVRAENTGGQLYLYRMEKAAVKEPIVPGRRCSLDWPAVTVAAYLRDRTGMKLVKRPGARRVALDWEQIEPPLEIRTLRPGDSFRPLGMKGAKKVGDYLTDRKVPRPLRNEILLLCDRRGPLWLMGYEIADRVKIVSATRKVLTVGYTVRQPDRRQTV